MPTVAEIKEKLTQKATEISSSDKSVEDQLADALNTIADLAGDLETAVESPVTGEASETPTASAEADTVSTSEMVEASAETVTASKGSGLVLELSADDNGVYRLPVKQTGGNETLDLSAGTVKYSVDGEWKSSGEFLSHVGNELKSIHRSKPTGSHSTLFNYKQGTAPDLHERQSEDEILDVLNRKLEAVTARSQNRINHLARAENIFQAGGIGPCMPPTPVPEFCPTAPFSGGLDIASFTMPPAGIRLPSEPDVSALFENLQCLTEADEMARDQPKPCFSLTCPTWTDITPCLIPLCVEVDTITRWAFPQMISKVLAEVMRLFMQWRNQNNLANMWDASVKVDFTGQGGRGTLNDVIDFALKIASFYRTKHRVQDAPLRMAVPDFFAYAVASDATRRATGMDDFVNMAKATFETVMARKNIEVAWVFDWQDAQATGTANGWGGTDWNTATQWPESVNIMIYEPNTWSEYNEEIIRVQGLRQESGLLRDNKELALFVETAHALVQRCKETVGFTMPICNWGVNSIAEIDLSGTCPR